MSDDSKTDQVAERSDDAHEPSGGDHKPSGGDHKPSGGEEPRSAVLREPPLPAAGTPDGEALRRGLALYQLGNYREMRAVLEPLVGSKDPAVADAASALLRRIAVDPVQIGVLVVCLLAITAIAYHYLA
jgi:hypothetical protein